MSLRIFLVEDNAIIRDNLIELFEELMPAKVVGWAPSQSEAIAWLDAHSSQWNLAVVDMFLTEGNGLGVLQHFKYRSTAQKMVVLSNYATAEIRNRCINEGADAVFDKSQELDEFTQYAICVERSDTGGYAGDVCGAPADSVQ